MSDQGNTSEGNNNRPLENILDGEVTSYINGFIDQNAGKIIATAEEKARLAAQKIIDKAREKAEAEVDRIILESRAEVEKNAQQTIKEAEEKVSWFVLEVLAHVMEEAQIMKKDIVNKLVEERADQIIAKAQEKARSAAQDIVVKAREKAEVEARRIIEKAKEAADKSVQEIAKGADEEAARMVVEVKDAEETEAQSKKEDDVEQQPVVVSECKGDEPEIVLEPVQEVAQNIVLEASPAVAEVKDQIAVEEQPENEDLEKQAIVDNEAVNDVAAEAGQDVPEMAKEADAAVTAAAIKTEDKFKGRVIEFVHENDGGKDEASELPEEESVPVATPPPENVAPVQESAAVEKTEKPSIAPKSGDNEDFVIYKELVQLTLPPPIPLDHMLKLHKQLKNIPDVKVTDLTGSLNKGVKIELFLMTPMPLIGVLKAIPEVEKALELNEKKLVHAGRQKGNQPTTHSIIIKLKK